MHKQIDDFEKEAIKYADSYGDRYSIVWFAFYNKKFAELLIRECAEVCRRQQYYDADDEHKRGVNDGSITCMNAIKQQFRVEE